MHRPGYVQGGQDAKCGYLLLGIYYRRIPGDTLVQYILIRYSFAEQIDEGKCSVLYGTAIWLAGLVHRRSLFDRSYCSKIIRHVNPLSLGEPTCPRRRSSLRSPLRGGAWTRWARTVAAAPLPAPRPGTASNPSGSSLLLTHQIYTHRATTTLRVSF